MDEMNNNDFNPQYDYTQAEYNDPIKGNKKTHKHTGILLVALAVGAVVAVVIFVLALVLKEKECITAEQFRDYMENREYVVADITNQYDYVDYIEKVYLAIDLDDQYQIEFYEFDSDAETEKFYLTNRSIFESYEDSARVTFSLSGINYNKYSLTTTASYKLVSQIGNTAIYVDTDKDNKAEIETYLKELGY